MNGRLPASVIATGLMRRAESEGGFAAVLAKGDPSSGAIVVILAEKGRKVTILERVLASGGAYIWQNIAAQVIEDEEKFRSFIERRRHFDPDLWLIELDVASAERFAAEMNCDD